MKQQPKPYINGMKMRNKAYGLERRRNMSKMILEHAPNFPLSVELKDIDQEFQNWVENGIDISYDGKKLPTFKLFSNQRINEYAQSWQHLDEASNLLMNFKTVTRENNPLHGNNQGGSYNIPGERYYPMFIVPVLGENGQHHYEQYSMKQPMCVDVMYSVSIITNKYELINTMNQLMLDKFKSIDCYIAPNYHFMPMTLEDISDSSEYGMDDRKYYSQTFRIKIKAYVIKESDYKVEELCSRLRVRMLGVNNKKKKPTIKLIEDYVADECCLRTEEDPFANKGLTLEVNFPSCEKETKFVIDNDMVIEQVETSNVYDFIVWVNGEKQDFENGVTLYNEDEIRIEISKDEYTEDSSVVFSGYDPNVRIDTRIDTESALDEEISDETIVHNA
jgi:hypothetical protein